MLSSEISPRYVIIELSDSRSNPKHIVIREENGLTLSSEISFEATKVRFCFGTLKKG